MAVLLLSFAALLAALTLAEQSDGGDVVSAATSDSTISRFKNQMSVLPFIEGSELDSFIASISRCHEGYSLSGSPYQQTRSTPETDQAENTIAAALDLSRDAVVVGYSTLSKNDFGYVQCRDGEMQFPFEGLVVSVQQPSGLWLHAEVHPHEQHLGSSFLGWFQRSAGVFVLIAAVTLLFIHRLGRPLNRLTTAAKQFGDGLKVDHISETGPPDIRRTIQTFNAMQDKVKAEVQHRTNTLAALSHDLRTPLTGLRVKAELIEDTQARDDLLVSIRKMEAIVSASLEFLRGESLDEPMRLIDLTALVDSECADFEENGQRVTLATETPVLCNCRPDAVARAVRNLIDNALKYGLQVEVAVVSCNGWAEVRVADQGPGLPNDQIDVLTQPFVRHQPVGTADRGGYGLGLAVVKAVADGHDGELVLERNRPKGLLAILRIPSAISL